MVATAEIEVRALPAHTVAWQRFHSTVPSIEAHTAAVRSWVVTMGYKVLGPLAVEFSSEPVADTSVEYDIEIQLPVEDRAKAVPEDQIQIKRFEPAEAAVITLHGPWEVTGLAEPLGQLRAWMQERGLRPGNAIRWVEITDPTRVSAGEQLTEIQYLVSR